jgi:hypothetical protein
MTKLKFVSNEPIAAAIREVAKAKAANLPSFFTVSRFAVIDGI